MPEEPRQPEDLKVVIGKVAHGEQPDHPDKNAEREQRAIATESYDLQDAGDSYGVRRALKKQVEEHAGCLFWTLYWIIFFVCVLVAAMGVSYVYHLVQQPDKLGAALGSIATHIMAGALGFFAWAWWGKAQK